MWPITLSGRLPIVALVGRYLTNQLIGRELTPHRIAPLTPSPCDVVVSCGISTCFQVLSPCVGQIAHALLTRPPLKHLRASSSMSPLDLHVLGTPPAFVLSQDQTLMFNPTPLTGANRLTAFLTRSESDCSFCSSFSISFSRIAPSPPRPLALARAPRDNIDYYTHLLPLCQHLFESFLIFVPSYYIHSFRALFYLLTNSKTDSQFQI